MNQSIEQYMKGVPVRTCTLPQRYLHNLAFNDLLNNNPEVSALHMMKQLGEEFHIDLSRFWFCLTGLKKEIYYSVYGYEGLDYTAVVFEKIWGRAEEILKQEHYKADLFLLWLDSAKQLAIFMSPGPDARLSPEEAARRVGAAVQAVYEEDIFHGDRRYCNVTALSDELHGYGELWEAFRQVKELDSLSFFQMEPVVFTPDAVERCGNGAEYQHVMEACRQLSAALDEGDGGEAERKLNILFLELLKNSYSVSLCRDALSYCKNVLEVRSTVYGCLDGVDLERLCSVERYLKIEACAQALSPVLTTLCAAVRERGPCSRAVLRAMYYIKTHYVEDISLTDVARYTNVNPNYISGIFRENTGMALRDYLTQTRVEAAKKLLAEREMRVADAARAVGFSDAKYFGQVFRRLTGVSPARYRQKQT